MPRAMRLREKVRARSLATRLTVRTLGLMAVFVAISSLFALVGVQKLVSDATAERLHTYTAIIADDIGARLETADRILSSVALNQDAMGDDDALRQAALDRFASTYAEYFDAIVVVDASGRVVGSSPTWRNVSVPLAITASIEQDGRGFLWGVDEAGARRLWVARSMEGSGGFIAVGRARTGFLRLLIDAVRAASPDTIAAVLDANSHAVAVPVGVAAVEWTSMTFESDANDPTQGTVRVRSDERANLSGAYAIVGDTAGLRVVAVGPDAGAVVSTVRALAPAAVTVLIGAIGFALIAGVFAVRLVTPLRDVEARARDITSGGYVRPLKVERDDEVGRLADAFNVMVNRINLLQDMSQLLASASSLDQVLDGIIAAAGHLLGTGRIAVFLVERDGSLSLVRASGKSQGAPERIVLPLDTASIVGRAYRAGSALSFSAGPEEDGLEPLIQLFGEEHVRSGLAAPLIIGRETSGVVISSSDEDRRYTEADAEMMRSLSAQAAVAVENARLFNEQERSREEAEALRAVAELLVSPEDLGVALDEVARVAGDLLGAHCGGFAFSDRETLSLPPAEDVELEAARLQILDMLLLTRASEAADAEPLMIDADTLTGDARRFADERGIGRMLIVPLIEEEHTRGMLLLGCPEEEGAFTARQISLADTIGKEVSLALRNAYLFGRERARSANLERIFRISQAVSSSLQITTVLNRVLDVVQKIFTADAVALMRVDAVSRRIETSMARGIKSKELLFFAVDPGEDIPGRVFATMRPQRFDDLREESGPLAELAAEQGLRSLLVVPLVARGRSIGLLNVFAAEPSAFANEDMELLLTFGSQAALAVDTADLYGREHRVASVLQASILPQQLPHIDGLDAHSVYRPGSVEAEIGGDYYDLFKTPDGRVILAIGDVCGQGVRAATKTSMIKYLIRGLATAGLDPSAVLVELNRMASETGESSDIVTAWVGRLDLKRRVLEYASGGHPPSLVTSPDGSVAALEPTGPLLGAVPWAEYDLRLVRLEPGATLLLYTDGVTEARSRGELFGEARMRELAAQGGTAAEVTQRVLSAVNAFVGDSELKDDIAMLAVQLTDIETGA